MTRTARRLAPFLLGTWMLIQTPAKDMKLSNPGSNMPPIMQFKKVREFPSADACESFRAVALQDGALEGSDAMMDQSSSLRCVPAEQLAPPTPAPAATVGPR